jgi:hypothetical protein
MDPYTQMQESSAELAASTDTMRLEIAAALDAYPGTAGLSDTIKQQVAGQGAQIVLMNASQPVIMEAGVPGSTS